MKKIVILTILFCSFLFAATINSIQKNSIESKKIDKKQGKLLVKKTKLDKYLTPCRLNNSCLKKSKKYIWEIDKNQILKNIKIRVNKINIPNTFVTVKGNDANETFSKKYLLRFYVDRYFSYNLGQKPISGSRLKDDHENLKLGLQYEYYFKKFWKFYTDDRVIMYRKHTNDGTTQGVRFEVKELYIRSYGLFDNQFNILLGRKFLKDYRSWWYNSSLDTVKVFNERDLLKYEVFAGGRLNSDNTITDNTSSTHDLKDTRFFVAHLDYQYYFLNHLGAFFVYEDTSPSNPLSEKRNLKWFGLRAYGTKVNYIGDKFKYWADLGYVQGDIKTVSSKNIKGLGAEVGILYHPVDKKYSFASSLAYGEGSKNSNNTYVQPYISNNKSNFLTKNLTFKYYGEFLDPELSNILIASIYGTYKYNPKSTFVLALHNYRQIEANKNLIASSYVVATNGVNTDIGNEIDFIYGFNVPFKYYWKIGLSYFKGGSAFNNVTTKKDGLHAAINFRYYW